MVVGGSPTTKGITQKYVGQPDTARLPGLRAPAVAEAAEAPSGILGRTVSLLLPAAGRSPVSPSKAFACAH